MNPILVSPALAGRFFTTEQSEKLHTNITSYIRREGLKSMIFSFHNKNLEKDEQIKPKVSRQKEIIKIRIETEEIEKK